MLENEELTNAIVWVDNLDEVSDIIANLVAMWVRDDVPEELYEEMEKVAGLYTNETMKNDVKKVFVDGFFADRKKEIEDALKNVNENKEKVEE